MNLLKYVEEEEEVLKSDNNLLLQYERQIFCS